VANCECSCGVDRLVCAGRMLLRQGHTLVVRLGDNLTVAFIRICLTIGRIILENFLCMRADLGAYASSNMLSHLFPILAI